MTKDERIEERELKRWRKRMLNEFLLEEADESEDDFISETEEDGFRDAYANFLPLDSNGQPYIKFVPGTKRLLPIVSIEFMDLTNQERMEVVRTTRIHNEIHNA